jgi:hypothetical protein
VDKTSDLEFSPVLLQFKSNGNNTYDFDNTLGLRLLLLETVPDMELSFASTALRVVILNGFTISFQHV